MVASTSFGRAKDKLEKDQSPLGEKKSQTLKVSSVNWRGPEM